MEQVNNIDEYLKILERYKDTRIYYRGQLEKYTNISPSIARNPGYLANECDIYHEAIKLNEEEFKGLLTPLEKLAKLQHYGIPTRLVDVTIDPLIALYFAVEDFEDISSGNVYLYLEQGYPINSKEAKLLSIIPTLSELNVKKILNEYNILFGDCLSYKEVLEIVCRPIIIQYSKELQKFNSRLYSQKGTFLICGNEVENDILTNKLMSLDTIKPTVIIRIPYEYKKEIKNELDLKYSINKTRIYPELPSVADYIREKYKEENLSSDYKYSILKKEDVSHAFAKRISFSIVLLDPMHIDKIKSIVINIIEKYKKSEDVIWVYVARNGDDYILNNWMLRGQWINPNLNEAHRPITFQKFEEGYYWDYDNTYSILSDVYNENVFDDDKTLFVNHDLNWKRFCKIYQKIRILFQDKRWDELLTELVKQKSIINQLLVQFQEFGHSHNINFDKFLDMFADCIILVYTLYFYIENDSLSLQSKRYQVNKILNEVEDKIYQIDQKISYWGNELHIAR